MTMKKLLMIPIVLSMCTLSVLAQDFRMPANTIEPKVPVPEDMPATLPEADLPEQGEPSQDDIEILNELKGLVIVDSLGAVKPEGITGMLGYLDVHGIEFLDDVAFEELVLGYVGKPVTFRSVRQMQRDIILFYRERYRPLVDVILPEQNVEKGVLQMVVVEGRVGEVVVENPEPKGFRDEVILKQMRVGVGEVVDSRELLEDVDWLNKNPFRRVDVLFRQGKRFGESDVVLRVEDRVPVRIYGGYEDTGTEAIGEDRVLVGLNWGNAFFADHQFNYQYTRDIDFDLLEAHSGSYVIPLPWRHVVSMSGSYVEAFPDLGGTSTNLNQTGRSSQISGRYLIGMEAIGEYEHEVTVGVDFKKSNNNLQFGSGGGAFTISSSETEIVQFELGYSGLMPDELGQFAFGGELFFSPGGLTGGNEDEEFDRLRGGAQSDYVYVRLHGERVTRLKGDFSWVFRGRGQLSTENLLPSEQLGFGGYATIRGYDEREANGDQGWMLSNELRSPAFSIGEMMGMESVEDQLQVLGFWDYGVSENKNLLVGEDPHVVMSSVGVGVRVQMKQNLSVRADYGFQLTDSGRGNPDNARAHIGATLGF